MKVLTDLHHGDLYYSLHCLFEKRLDFELYTIIGPEWADNYWKIHEIEKNDEVINQYLKLNEGEFIVNNKNFTRDNIHYFWSQYHSYYRKHIDLNTFKDMDFDIILPTYYAHYEPWKELQEKYQPNAKIICHIGNQIRGDKVDFALRSTEFFGESKLDVYCTQELNRNRYDFTFPDKDTRNIFSVNAGWHKDILFKYKNLLNQFNWKFYGSNAPDGLSNNVFKAMKESNLGISLKPLSGLCHNNMGWMYSGRALITTMSGHTCIGGKALELHEPGVTCIDIESGTEEENCKLIKEWVDPDKGLKYALNAKRRFHEVVNYEQDAENVKSFLSKIL